ncbi:3-ketoacyl-ACP reductase [Frankia sp. CcI49]|uniref:mycofactocin-coupled SDR family oxidoreductase n=1 Tax=unclassified Frankia TaxID=2632575 RepID=UPI0006CA076F|nr:MULTISPECIES: mycofactocin-coupled SDR family oxidoreductase [unclassified Frankia]KPM54360.1 3-ketoacyl-ACP reductase [Frankia sp. R43]ONH58785.1 3-ketoacyl-ACP reductase [Frankia sp. CcI49]
MGLLEGKVAFITGAARGQGRSHAVRLAQEGADIIAVDICAPIDTVAYALASEDDLAETAAEVRAHGRRIVARQADVRDRAGLREAFEAGVAELGGCDIVLANAGIAPMAIGADDPAQFLDVVAVNLVGVWNTVEVAKQALIDRGPGGSVVLTSSTAGLRGVGGDAPGSIGYAASKHGVVGLMRSYANALAPHSIRVNTVHPTGVNTPMIINPVMEKWITTVGSSQAMSNALPVPYVEASDVTNAILWLVSDAARYVTGVTLPVDAGILVK